MSHCSVGSALIVFPQDTCLLLWEVFGTQLFSKIPHDREWWGGEGLGRGVLMAIRWTAESLEENNYLERLSSSSLMFSVRKFCRTFIGTLLKVQCATFLKEPDIKLHPPDTVIQAFFKKKKWWHKIAANYNQAKTILALCILFCIWSHFVGRETTLFLFLFSCMFK